MLISSLSNHLTVTVLSDFERGYSVRATPEGRNDRSEYIPVFDASQLERLFSHLTDLEIGIDDAIDLLIGPHTFTHAITLYLFDRLGIKRGEDAVNVVKTALRKSLSEFSALLFSSDLRC